MLCEHGKDENLADDLTEKIFDIVKSQDEYREI